MGLCPPGSPQAAAPGIGKIGNPAGRVVAAALVGGTASASTGGKFANGAVTAAFSVAFASAAQELAQQSAEDIPTDLSKVPTARLRRMMRSKH